MQGVTYSGLMIIVVWRKVIPLRLLPYARVARCCINTPSPSCPEVVYLLYIISYCKKYRYHCRPNAQLLYFPPVYSPLVVPPVASRDDLDVDVFTSGLVKRYVMCRGVDAMAAVLGGDLLVFKSIYGRLKAWAPLFMRSGVYYICDCLCMQRLLFLVPIRMRVCFAKVCTFSASKSD